MKLGHRVVLIGLALFALSVGGASAAQALPGGAWASSSAPLTVNYAGYKPVGYSYGVWQGYRENQGRGSRIQDSSYSKTRAGYPGSDRGAYTQHKWYWNGSYCYVSSFSSSGGSTSCGSGWHASGTTNSGSNKSSSWKYWESWHGVDAKADSGRGEMHTCWNVVSAPDSCSSASYLRGAAYGN